MVIKKSGYTLLEMLVAVTIFSGLLIIVLGSVASSSSSAARTSVLREKTEAARSLIDQVSNDFRYIYTDTSTGDTNGGPTFTGYYFTTNGMVMLLKFPSTSSTEFVRKEYSVKTIDNRLTLAVDENRSCELRGNNNNVHCDPNGRAGERDLLSGQFALNGGATDFLSDLSGLTIPDGAATEQNGWLKINFTVKPIDYAPLNCENSTQVPEGTCYEIATTLVPNNQ
ncbi:hypothetical protein A3A71_01945 [Candidatus Berkelbacteria bacterium RIFCSPLOWO2_01_FULL_50_28]|uniref:Type II secretion system protein J n=1 Tax=Candidatus Berkelbacteria bacterium RIFCSPLOWO2_01_FULL_50_28 TaxID=1797471 RepID=A0A1F5EBZ1_9BACT|nr:MAG: hypothetical protein A3F39_00090 [Candidatus Berkelbacteria bacterium RIFCSPHIGHO2_12_FULL_50_11]OGD64786.1 MAG: hypothetical protein A3A71_01945 [Candidatus Berkelbacteria bacterium RIFCSPLOWO2_01_FULL_50_28]